MLPLRGTSKEYWSNLNLWLGHGAFLWPYLCYTLLSLTHCSCSRAEGLINSHNKNKWRLKVLMASHSPCPTASLWTPLPILWNDYGMETLGESQRFHLGPQD
jgi:hypothetical protein